MIAVKGTVKNGHVVLDDPTGLSEGMRVEVMAFGTRIADPITDDGPLTAEEIAELLRRMDEIEPLETTPEEEAGLAEERKQQKEYELSCWDRRSRRIEDMFE